MILYSTPSSCLCLCFRWSMSQPLPVGGFKFLSKGDIKKIDFTRVPDDGEVGYMLEVDLLYPPELHDLHNDLPLAPESMVVQEEMLSPYQLQMKESLGLKSSNRIAKLIPNFYPKHKYVLHYRNLKFYLEQGLILTKIHRVIRFEQKPWIRPYIEFNTRKRQEATSSSGKDFFKFMNNSMFGKTMENLRKQCQIKLASSAKTAHNYVAKPNFQSFHQINEELVAIRMRQVRIKWDKPSFTGACVLDLAKLHLYNFHYNIMKKKYGQNLTLLFTDTDSLCYHIVTKDLYSDMDSFKDRMDTANFPRDHPCYSLRNDRRIGYFKDECAAVQPMEFVGLRAKMYSLLMPEGHSDKQTAKGVQRAYAKRHLKHMHFVGCLKREKISKARFYNIRSKNHVLKTIAIIKESLSAYDDKRFILDDGIRSLSYGHRKIRELVSRSKFDGTPPPPPPPQN